MVLNDISRTWRNLPDLALHSQPEKGFVLLWFF
jgi:hypothetical protein